MISDSEAQLEVEDEVQVPLDQQEVLHPMLDWSTAPERFRRAHEHQTDQVNRLKGELEPLEARHADDQRAIADLSAEVVFLKAGVDTESAVGAMFARSFNPESLSPAEVRRAYAEYLQNATAEAERFASVLARNGRL
jgi:hypothetical protein